MYSCLGQFSPVKKVLDLFCKGVILAGNNDATIVL